MAGVAQADSEEGLVTAVDFESREVGSSYLAAFWGEDGFSEPTWSQGFDEDRVVVADAGDHRGSSRSIRVAYPKSGFGPGETGAQVSLGLEPRDEYYLSYWLRFEEGFSWGREHHGGKLPGLAGGDLCSGGASCDGANGFTARMMWRREGKAVLYLYHMDKPGAYGEDFDMVYPSGDDVVFTPGKWFQIIERVRVNSAGSRDGLVQLWVNGEPTLSVEGLRFVTNGDQVDQLFFSTFHGGNDAQWAPQRDSYIRFDDFKVGTTYDAVR